MVKYNSHEDYAEIFIRKEAESILKQITGGRIYGKEVNLRNLDHLIVASYLIGSNTGHLLACTAYDDAFKRISDGKP